MKKFSKILMAAVLGMFLVAGSASATLLGVKLGLPDIESNHTGTYNYDATTDIFTSTATAYQITFDGVNSIDIDDGSYSVSFEVDDSGNFVGGVTGFDLTISGKIDSDGDGSYDYTGDLVLGEVTAFGFFKIPGVNQALFDFTFDIDASSTLAGFYPGGKGGDKTYAENTAWTGTWDVDHSGTSVKHDTAPVPEPATMLLLGVGLIGLAGASRKKIFKA